VQAWRHGDLDLHHHCAVDDPAADITPAVLLDVVRRVAWQMFPLLAPERAPVASS
jgi:hypothetical protein